MGSLLGRRFPMCHKPWKRFLICCYPNRVIIRYDFKTLSNLLSFALDRMVLSTRDILCFKDISEKGTKHRHLASIWYYNILWHGIKMSQKNYALLFSWNN
jgi:hypothetical protein